MKIIFITYIYPYPERGFNPGIERVVQEFAQELANQGHEIHVITTYRNGGSKKTEVENGVTLHRITDTRHYLGRLGSALSLDLLSINLKITEYNELLDDSDVVHTFTPIIWKFFSTPLVAHYHHWSEVDELIEHLYLPISQRLWLLCYETADRVFTPSDFSAVDLVNRGIDRSKIEIVPNGVDTQEYYPGKSEIDVGYWETTLLFVGPLTERKGVKTLIYALEQVVIQHPNTGLIVVGGGDFEEYQQLAIKLDLLDHIRFEGFVADKDLPEYYRAADLFIFPSQLEGFGMVLLEAMASGLPIISTNATAIPEVVGDAGILVPPKDHKQLAKEISDMISQENGKYHIAGIKRVIENYTWKQTTHSLVQKYKNLISNQE